MVKLKLTRPTDVELAALHGFIPNEEDIKEVTVNGVIVRTYPKELLRTWLREAKNLHINIDYLPYLKAYNYNINTTYDPKYRGIKYSARHMEFKTYDLALDQGLSISLGLLKRKI